MVNMVGRLELKFIQWIQKVKNARGRTAFVVRWGNKIAQVATARPLARHWHPERSSCRLLFRHGSGCATAGGKASTWSNATRLRLLAWKPNALERSWKLSWGSLIFNYIWEWALKHDSGKVTNFGSVLGKECQISIGPRLAFRGFAKSLLQLHSTN